MKSKEDAADLEEMEILMEKVEQYKKELIDKNNKLGKAHAEVARFKSTIRGFIKTLEDMT